MGRTSGPDRMWNGFGWDPPKAAYNLKEHGVAFEEAQSVFDDPLSRTIHDPDHSYGEERYLTMGLCTSGRLLVVCHCDRGDKIWLISARDAEGHERRAYENRPSV